jgi:phenylpyruvate tautomerase PptA (4-oxalocrotonate tautomerase family)
MPFIEIVGVAPDQSRRAELCELLTEEMAQVLNISAEIITIYFFDIAPHQYAHAGKLEGPDRNRVFLKIHAFARDVRYRRQLAESLTEILVKVCEWPRIEIAIYFFERAPEEVAHGGVLESDAILSVEQGAFDD